MKLYEQWKKMSEEERDSKQYDNFWNTYLEKEKKIYIKLLEGHGSVVEGKLSELATVYDMDNVVFTGFLDGINTSLVEMLDIEALDEDSPIKLEADFEKLFWNMLEAKAEWLYTLEQWEDILSVEKRIEIRKEFNRSKTATSSKVGRNDPCPCGSGKKYKKCCGRQAN
jgi:hypothetical protein